MALVVQKYGGTSVATVERIERLACRVASAVQQGHQVVVVVSARGDTTDQLLTLASSIARRPHQRELDRLLATGETQSMSLVALALGELGIPARSFDGGQAGIRSGGAHGKARINRIATGRLRRALEAGYVAVVAGFQGLNHRGDVQTLGRGGSDTTAVALAAALGAPTCEIFTDVDGVFSADPRIVPDAVRHEVISATAMAEMAWRGARVMHPRAIELGARYGVEIVVRSSLNEGPGTRIVANAATTVTVSERSAMERSTNLSGVVHDLGVARLTIGGLASGPEALALVFSALARAEISVDVIAENAAPNGDVELSFTVKESEVEEAVTAVERVLSAPNKLGSPGRVRVQTGLAKVSLVGTGMLNRPGYVARLFTTLAKAGVASQMVTTSEISVTCVIAAEQAALAVRQLHATFRRDLDANQAGATCVPDAHEELVTVGGRTDV